MPAAKKLLHRHFIRPSLKLSSQMMRAQTSRFVPVSIRRRIWMTIFFHRGPDLFLDFSIFFHLFTFRRAMCISSLFIHRSVKADCFNLFVTKLQSIGTSNIIDYVLDVNICRRYILLYREKKKIYSPFKINLSKFKIKL